MCLLSCNLCTYVSQSKNKYVIAQQPTPVNHQQYFYIYVIIINRRVICNAPSLHNLSFFSFSEWLRKTNWKLNLFENEKLFQTFGISSMFPRLCPITLDFIIMEVFVGSYAFPLVQFNMGIITCEV